MSDSDDGPMPMPVPVQRNKRRKVLTSKHEELYLSRMPGAQMYEKSFMHRDVVTHIKCTSTDFIISASSDGHVKFWKKMAEGIEFVKHYRAHKGPLVGLDISQDGKELITVGVDKKLTLFDIVAFDMTAMLRFEFEPLAACFCSRAGAAATVCAVSSKEDGIIRFYNLTTGEKAPVRELRLHEKPPHLLCYLPAYHACLSADTAGFLELWCPETLKMPERGRAAVENAIGASKPIRDFAFEMKSETHLYELVKAKTHAVAVAPSPTGMHFALLCEDGNVRIFRAPTCKLMRVYDETLEGMSTAQSDPLQQQLHLDRFDFGRRVAQEKELLKSPQLAQQTLAFDETGNFLLYPSLVGIKVVNVLSNKLCRILGKVESSERFLAIAFFPSKPGKKKMDRGEALMRTDEDGHAVEVSDVQEGDPTVFACSFKKKRFFLFTKREPVETSVGGRDVFNEKPTKEDQEQAHHELDTGEGRKAKSAILQTTMGDIVLKLFPKECPRTVENFTVHARNGYYDNVIFHRVIPEFMIQTGDPNGDGTGGESIWGGDFEDEFHRALKHDRPFMVSMANAGPNTNGSQFFITTVPCSWLDNKHTVFARVEQGIDVVQGVEKVQVDQEDRPLADIKILAIKLTC